MSGTSLGVTGFKNPKAAKRIPDLAIFGPESMDRQGVKVPVVKGMAMNPHVSGFKFSGANNMDYYEVCAVDDMMNVKPTWGDEYSCLERPNVAYTGSKALRRGRATSDSRARVWIRYLQSAQQDEDTNKRTYNASTVLVGRKIPGSVFTPAEMGLTGDEGQPFTISLREIQEEVKNLGIKFVAAREDEM